MGPYRSIDDSYRIYPKNQLGNIRNIGDYYFHPHLLRLKENISLPTDQQKPHFQAATIQGKLSAVKLLYQSSISRDVFCWNFYQDVTDSKTKTHEIKTDA